MSLDHNRATIVHIYGFCSKPAKTRQKPATRQTRQPAKFLKLEPATTRNPPKNLKNRPRVHP